MIICNSCGGFIEENARFCVECGAVVAIASDYGAQPTQQISPAFPAQPLNSGSVGTAAAPAKELINNAPVTTPVAESETVGLVTSTGQGNMKILIVGIVLVAVVAIGAAVYFAVQSSPTARAAAALQSAIDSGRLITTSNDDAYFYYLQLKTLDPTHRTLREIIPQVLPQLRTMGNEIFRKKVTVNSEKPTDQDWARMVRVYDWARQLETNDKSLEARWKFAEGEVAKSQKRLDEAERHFAAAAQIDNSWALPQNSLGLLRSESRKWADAIPYYQRATELQPDWEIPYNNMGTSYFYLKSYDTAEQWYNAALSRNPNWARPHYWLGCIYQNKGQKTEAISHYQAALSLDTTGESISSEQRNQMVTRIAQLQR
jgi:tetratricopeptide (TPR) repeat protein